MGRDGESQGQHFLFLSPDLLFNFCEGALGSEPTIYILCSSIVIYYANGHHLLGGLPTEAIAEHRANC